MGFKELLLGETENSLPGEATLKDLFDEQDFFEGIVRLKVERLVPKKGK